MSCKSEQHAQIIKLAEIAAMVEAQISPVLSQEFVGDDRAKDGHEIDERVEPTDGARGVDVAGELGCEVDRKNA